MTNDARRSEKNAKPISIVQHKEDNKQSVQEPNAAFSLQSDAENLNKINCSTTSCQDQLKNSLMVDKSEESYEKQPQDARQQNETSFIEVR